MHPAGNAASLCVILYTVVPHCPGPVQMLYSSYCLIVLYTQPQLEFPRPEFLVCTWWSVWALI